MYSEDRVFCLLKCFFFLVFYQFLYLFFFFLNYTHNSLSLGRSHAQVARRLLPKVPGEVSPESISTKNIRREDFNEELPPKESSTKNSRAFTEETSGQRRLAKCVLEKIPSELSKG